MKLSAAFKIIIFIFLVSIFSTSGMKGQEHHFLAEGGKVFWQQVFVKESLAADSLLKAFKVYIFPRWSAQDAVVTAEGFSFFVTDGVIDFKKYGGNNLNTGLFARQGHYFKVEAEFREGRYRITLSQIQNIEMRMESVNQPIEESVLKRGESFYNTKMVKRGLRIMDVYFTEKFTLPDRAPQTKKAKDDW